MVNYNDAVVSTSEPSSSSNIDDEKPKFIDTINPLLSFSNDDLEAMNEDVNEFFESDSSDDSVDIGKIVYHSFEQIRILDLYQAKNVKVLLFV